MRCAFGVRLNILKRLGAYHIAYIWIPQANIVMSRRWNQQQAPFGQLIPLRYLNFKFNLCRHNTLDLLLWTKVQQAALQSSLQELKKQASAAKLSKIQEELRGCQAVADWSTRIFKQLDDIAQQLMQVGRSPQIGVAAIRQPPPCISRCLHASTNIDSKQQDRFVTRCCFLPGPLVINNMSVQ